MSLSPAYELRPEAPSSEDYLRLRHVAGLTPCPVQQARRAVAGGWRACHVVHEGEAVAMGRVISDGGWYFHVVDMAVVPEHQRQGIGDAMLSWLLEQIDEAAPEHAFVSLMADPPGRRLYERHGFTDTGGTVGMTQWRHKTGG